MTFRFAWGSLPNVNVTNVRTFLEGVGITLPAVQFGPPGTVDSRDFSIPQSEFDFRLFLAAGRDQFHCDLNRMGADDTFAILAVGSNQFLGNTFHATTALPNRCTVRCSSGTSGQGCIVCIDGNLTVRVCC